MSAAAKQIEDLEMRWAAQLSREHKTIAWRYGVNLTTPTINISSGKKRLGWWCSRTRTLSISSYLIKTQTWDIILEVLKHEMAHQYVTDVYNNADSHGKFFKLACQKLGVHRAFAGSGRNYDKGLQEFKGELAPEALRMLGKVEKLMALGQSGNEAEAHAASRKANYLLNKYNIGSPFSDDENPDIKYLTICHKKKRIESIQRAILSILKQYYYVDCLTSGTYHAKDDTTYKSVVLVGKEEALRVAEYTYYFLLDTSRTLWQIFIKTQAASRTDKLSFDMGFIAGVEHTHKKMFECSEMNSGSDPSLPVKIVKALMAQSRKENQIEVSRLFPKLKAIRYGRHQTSSDAFKEGYKNGKSLHIKKGLTNSDTNISGFLT